MKSKAVLEYILFFVINLCTVQLSLANYTKMESKEFSSLVIPAKHVVSAVPIILSSAGRPVHQVSTDLIMAMRTDEGLVSQTFTGEEEAMLKKLAAKVGRSDFDKLMVRYCKDKEGLLEIARAGQMDSNIASR